MGILGKVLIFLNLLAFGGWGYLAVQDWRGRQTIEGVALRHQILLQGLPLEGDTPIPARKQPTSDDYHEYAATEIPFRIEMAGGVPTRTVSPELLYVYFTAAGTAAAPASPGLVTNQPVASQLAEVKRVLGIVKKAVDAAEGAAGKTAVLAGYLELQPETYDERLEVLKLIRDKNPDELAKLLYARFDRVINPPKPDPKRAAKPDATPDSLLKETADLRSAGVVDQTERRAQLSHLLVHLDRDAAWQKRVMLVLGLRQYVPVSARQAVRFEVMTERVNRQIIDDDLAFRREYNDLRTRAFYATEDEHKLSEARQELIAQKEKTADLIAQRQTMLTKLRADFAAIKAQVDGLLVRQTAIESQLFEVQREVGATLEDIYRREAELAQVEREKYGKK